MKAIFACGRQGEFGLCGGLPWVDVAGDLAFFKDYTMGQTLIMGRQTYESLPFKLPGRKHVVISSRDDVSNKGETPDLIVRSLYDAPFDGIIIGGARILEDAIISAMCTEISITYMDGDYEADVHIDLPMIAENLSFMKYKAEVKPWGTQVLWTV